MKITKMLCCMFAVMFIVYICAAVVELLFAIQKSNAFIALLSVHITYVLFNH